jgi:hypothetical protein
MYFGTDPTPVQYIDNAEFPPISPDQKLKIGFGASSGGATAFHEIRNVMIKPLDEDIVDGACTI